MDCRRAMNSGHAGCVPHPKLEGGWRRILLLADARGENSRIVSRLSLYFGYCQRENMGSSESQKSYHSRQIHRN
jgi:hypothetical protein